MTYTYVKKTILVKRSKIEDVNGDNVLDKDGVLDAISSLEKTTICSVVQLTRGEQLQIRLWDTQWSIILGWVARNNGVLKDDSVLEAADAEYLEPAGDVLCSLLDLCIDMQKLLDKETRRAKKNRTMTYKSFPYGRAIDFWWVLVAEAKLTSFSKLGEKRGKREMEDDLERTIKALKNCFRTGVNPYDPEEAPEHHMLIEMAKMIGKHCDNDEPSLKGARKTFRDTFNKFVKALHAWKRSLKSTHCKAVYASRDSLMAIEGARKVSPVLFDDSPSICAQSL